VQVILTFDTVRDEAEYQAALHALRLVHALAEVDEALRAKLKYEDPSEETRTALEGVRSVLRDGVAGLPESVVWL